MQDPRALLAARIAEKAAPEEFARALHVALAPFVHPPCQPGRHVEAVRDDGLAEPLARAPRVALTRLEQRHGLAQRGIARVELSALPQVFARHVLPAAPLCLPLREVQPQEAVLRRRRQAVQVDALGGLVVPKLGLHLRPRAVGRRGTAIEGHRTAEVCARVLGSPGLVLEHGEALLQELAGRAARDAAAVDLHRSRLVAEALLELAERVPPRGMPAVGGDGRLKALPCSLGVTGALLEHPQRLPQVRVRAAAQRAAVLEPLARGLDAARAVAISLALLDLRERHVRAPVLRVQPSAADV
mmetsp:Transcript_562/g.2131  ORF Transcript_562/g.2131 Transcript_562/m.2131 type:complete len:300 (+) Transcript_562:531-1430(+)